LGSACRIGPMRILSRVFLLAIGLVSSLGASTGRAGTLVEFPNVGEQAKTKLMGYLTRPDAGLSALLGSIPIAPHLIRRLSCCMAAAAYRATPRKSPIGWAAGGMWL
jgi:hypothetical protein